MMWQISVHYAGNSKLLILWHSMQEFSSEKSFMNFHPDFTQPSRTPESLLDFGGIVSHQNLPTKVTIFAARKTLKHVVNLCHECIWSSSTNVV